MKLQEIFDQLTYGELSNLSIGGGAAGVISEAAWPRVLAHINLGLTALYKRFNLKEGRITVELQPGQFIYSLNSLYAVTRLGSSEAVRYIKDTSTNPFKDDILKLDKVLTDGGIEFPLNDSSNCYSINTPSSTVISVPKDVVNSSAELPEELETDNLEIVYRANHPKLVIPVGYYDPTRVTVQLPDTHLQALLFFVAMRANAPIGMREEFNASNNFAAKYEAECVQLETSGMQVDQGAQNTRMERGGWV